MDLSRPSPAPTRYAGIGLVVALHLAGIYALSAGLIKTPPSPPSETTLRTLPPDTPEPPKPIERPRAPEPTFSRPDILLVPPPEVPVNATPTDTSVRTAALTDDAGPTAGTGTPRAEPTVVPPLVQPRIATAGAVCSVMPRPEVPAVSWSGEAVLHVIATVRGGRVVGSEVRVTQGALDSKARRALQRSVEAALAGYQCQGDAMFQQDFAFRLD